jgi:hypothetical protein
MSRIGIGKAQRTELQTTNRIGDFRMRSSIRKDDGSVPAFLGLAIIALLVAIMIAVLYNIGAPTPCEGAVPP